MVLSYMRSTSSLEYVVLAEKINYEVTNLILNNFGAKKKIQKFEMVNRYGEFSDEEIADINKVLEKHNTDIEKLEVVRKIPDYLLKEKYKQFASLSSQIVNLVYEIESSYPKTVFRYLKRDLNIYLCLGVIKNLSNRLIDFCLLTHTRVEKLDNLLKMMHDEIKLLNGVIDSDKEKFKDLYKIITHMRYVKPDEMTDKFIDETNRVILETFYDNI